ncbi:MAG TPA: ATP-binding cassette domain-containing protein [Solirubrobacteraceae bacterium]|nr:ATP-binding cassette domain-containing protein [Solirubrobacteraceae bacterium]
MSHAPPSPDLAVSTRRLTKRYGRRTAVDALALAIPTGAVAGFVGPNGAGKTTTMAMLLGLVAPTGGEGTVLGEPLGQPRAFLSRVGALIETPAFYPRLTGAENLAVVATAGGRDPGEIPGLLDLVDLAGRGGDRFRGYSLGMKQRLGIAAALLGDPELLILDEPLNGLDPSGIHEMRRLIGRLADGSRTLLISSHVLAELDQVCDWLVVIDRGGLRYQGPATDFGARAATSIVAVPQHAGDLDRLQRLVARIAIDEGIALSGLHTQRPTLEERYLAVTNPGEDR